MTVPQRVSLEWRQFRLLSRDSVRRLLSSAVMSRETDPMQFATWMVALVATPPTILLIHRLFAYAVLALPTTPRRTLEAAVLMDRMFLLFYAMTATALLAALLWEALFPDRMDQEILGTLPVRPRTVAAARLAAAVLVALVFAAAIALPGGLLFVLISATTPLPGSIPVVLFAHFTATLAGCLFVFVTLIVVRGVVAMSLGAGPADRLAMLLQLVALVGLVQVVFHVPSLLPALAAGLLDGDPRAARLPPLWFAALYSWLSGWQHPTLPELASLGVRALALALIAVVPVYLVPARAMAHRALESQSRHRARPWSERLRHLASAVASPPTAAVFAFALASLGRNRRHLLIVVSHAAVALAVAAPALIAEALRPDAFAAPALPLLSAPLVMMFFLVFGVRSACLPPSDLEANWPFQLVVPCVRHARAAMRGALVLLAVAPVVALATAAALVARWPLTDALSVAIFNLLAGLFLVECALVGWNRIPFACAHAPQPETIRVRWLAFLVPFLAFAFLGAALQLAALGSPGATSVHVSAAAVLVVTLYLWNARQSARDTVRFDPPAGQGMRALNLSEALQ